MSLFHLLPAAASTMAVRIDRVFLYLILSTGLVALGIAATLLAFSIRYRRGAKVDRTLPPAGNRPLEIAWIAVPLLVFLTMFVWAAYEYVQDALPPAGAMPVFVVAKQWMWKPQHENGRREIDELHVPVGTPVRLVMTSQDVIHSFFVPAFRIKQDLVPGRYTTAWFEATRAGEYPLFCAEYCGSQHSMMRGRIIAMEPAAFARWLEQGATPGGMAGRGFELFRHYGCSGCHAAGSSVHAPDLNGLLGSVVHLSDGRSIIADEAYVRDSVLLPKKDVVAGFAPIMPSFAGQIPEEDLMAIIEYIRSTGKEG
ncbi:MAG TPA: cytochrome c oxidase subunit II [Rhodocyclaceae bacterium]